MVSVLCPSVKNDVDQRLFNLLPKFSKPGDFVTEVRFVPEKSVLYGYLLQFFCGKQTYRFPLYVCVLQVFFKAL